MANQVKLTSIERVIAGVYRDLKPVVELSENDLIEWAGEALEQIGAYTQLEEKVVSLDVDGYKAILPSGIHKVIQVAYKYTEGSPSTTPMLTTASPCTTCSDNGCDPECPTCADVCETSAQLIQNAELFLQYYKPNSFRATGYYYDHYKPLRLASGPFAIPHTSDCKDCTGISANCDQEYSLDWPYIKTSFQKGYICVAYVGQALDERGFPLIPDEVSYVEAIKRYIIYKLKYSEFLQGQTPAQVYAKLEDDWHWYCSQARSKATMPDTIDKLQNLRDQHIRLIPKVRRYQGFFGNLHTVEKLDLKN
tara:strand:+ start:1360 stop:2280 length:921 start_codon:yes stop_codon:yes gene_type:complete